MSSLKNQTIQLITVYLNLTKMNYIFSEIIDSILSKNGIYLDSIGINNWALNKKNTLLVLDELKKEKIALLGGDIYIYHDKTIIPTYDNWYFNRTSNENYVDESIQYAKNYINNYLNNKESVILFVLIPDI